MAYNRAIIMGRLTADPELRQTSSGKMLCRFTVACDRSYKSANGERQADFLSCIAFDKKAEVICRYFSKGKMIHVEGELRTGSYDDRNHPEIKHYTTDIAVTDISFCGDSASTAQQNSFTHQSQQSAPQTAPAQVSAGYPNDFEEVISDSELPF